MDKYVIAWHLKSEYNDIRYGGTQYDLRECQKICAEFNRKYPGLTHFPVLKSGAANAN